MHCLPVATAKPISIPIITAYDSTFKFTIDSKGLMIAETILQHVERPERDNAAAINSHQVAQVDYKT